MNPRAVAAKVLEEVTLNGRYLDAALSQALTALPREQKRDAALIQEMTYGVLRWFHQLEAIAAILLDKPLKEKDRDIHLLLLIGLYQLRHMRVAQHAAVTETVEAAASLKKIWAKNLINACLRTYLREEARAQAAVAINPSASFSHPGWLIEELARDWPEDWQTILAANNAHPPMALRINLRRQTRESFLARLAQAGIAAKASPLNDTTVLLDSPVNVTELPGFAQGDVSVQDAAAQFAAVLLDAQPGERVLDACAAPGGKTGQLLEHTPGLTELVALDKDAARVDLIKENLARLGLAATIITGDAGAPADWWDGRPFDRILADVPCSATGVIRRHPDIKLRRRPEDLTKIVATQKRLLEGLWPLLKSGGKLLYASCSILPVENEQQLAAFLARHPEAQEVELPPGVGRKRTVGRQILPGEANMDGFYYACLRKN